MQTPHAESVASYTEVLRRPMPARPTDRYSLLNSSPLRRNEALQRDPRKELAMLRNLARSAAIAGAAAYATWLLQALLDRRSERQAHAHRQDHKTAVASWEDEGGGLAPGHPALGPAGVAPRI